MIKKPPFDPFHSMSNKLFMLGDKTFKFLVMKQISKNILTKKIRSTTCIVYKSSTHYMTFVCQWWCIKRNDFKYDRSLFAIIFPQAQTDIINYNFIWSYRNKIWIHFSIYYASPWQIVLVFYGLTWVKC